MAIVGRGNSLEAVLLEDVPFEEIKEGRATVAKTMMEIGVGVEAEIDDGREEERKVA